MLKDVTFGEAYPEVELRTGKLIVQEGWTDTAAFLDSKRVEYLGKITIYINFVVL